MRRLTIARNHLSSLASKKFFCISAVAVFWLVLYGNFMINEKLRSDLEQCRAAMLEMLPVLWRGIYVKLLNEGFTEPQAIELLKAYIISQGNGDKKA